MARKTKASKKKAIFDWDSKPLTGETRTWKELDEEARKKGFSVAERIKAMGGPDIGEPDSRERLK